MVKPVQEAFMISGRIAPDRKPVSIAESTVVKIKKKELPECLFVIARHAVL
jgi:hypothetical protein